MKRRPRKPDPSQKTALQPSAGLFRPAWAHAAATWERALDWIQRRPWVYPAAVATIGAIVFGGAMANGFTTWDDNVYVTENPQIGDLSLRGIGRIFTSFHNCNYHPLTTLTYRIEYALVGLRPRLYHLDNVLLHLGAAVAAFYLARRWLRNEGGALLTALLFLLHPLRAESVAWIAERKDVLCTFLYVSSLLAYPPPGATHRSRRYLLSLGLCLLALLSKVMAATLPAALLLMLVWERRATRSEIVRLVPFFLLAAVFGALGVAAQAADDAIQGLNGRNLFEHILTIPAAIAFYAKKLFLPIVLSPRYTIPPVESLFDGRVIAGLVIVASATWLVVRSFPRRGTAFLGLSFFAVTWAPVSGIVSSGTVVADRYLYLPSLGLFVALVGWIRPGAGRASDGQVSLRRVGTALLFAFLCWCLWLTPARVGKWKDTYTLWTDALGENPANCIAHNQLSTEYFCDGRYAESQAWAKASVHYGLRQPRYLYNLGMAYRGLRDYEKELATMREIVERDPDFLPAWLVVLRHMTWDRKLDEAEKILRRLEKRFPGQATLVFARAEIERARGNLKEALALVLRSIQMDPGDPEVRIAGAVIVAQMGDYEKALEAVRGAFEMQRGDVDPAMRERLAELIGILEWQGTPNLQEEARKLRKVASLQREEREE